jgi:hypothetical protein
MKFVLLLTLLASTLVAEAIYSSTESMADSSKYVFIGKCIGASKTIDSSKKPFEENPNLKLVKFEFLILNPLKGSFSSNTVSFKQEYDKTIVCPYPVSFKVGSEYPIFLNKKNKQFTNNFPFQLGHINETVNYLKTGKASPIYTPNANIFSTKPLPDLTRE